MRVYRYVSQEELRIIMQGDFESLGRVYSKKDMKYNNSHRYKENVRYLHFFKHKEDLGRIRSIYRNCKSKFYFCEFEIPLSLLMFHYGKGYYYPAGYDIQYDTAKEYAIPSSKMKKEFFKGYQIDMKKLEIDERNQKELV